VHRFLALLTVALVAMGCGGAGLTVNKVEEPAFLEPPSVAPGRQGPLASLRGATVGIDPGHNGRNHIAPEIINRLVWDGRDLKACNTTGTETADRYAESAFTFAVATELRTILRSVGARVVMTRRSNKGVGPCVDERARIINRARADIAIDIHADGGPADGRGFAVLRPVPSGRNDGVVRESQQYAAILRRTFEVTGMPRSDYLGRRGLDDRDDLAGLNLTTVPQVIIECGNMRNAKDARLLRSPRFQRIAAEAIALAMARFLATRPDR
jgi:N-acetylmuramoyl-L-alanine amidase